MGRNCSPAAATTVTPTSPPSTAATSPLHQRCCRRIVVSSLHAVALPRSHPTVSSLVRAPPKEQAMSDNLRRYRAIRDALIQGYPGQPTGMVARHLTTLAALISGIVGSQ